MKRRRSSDSGMKAASEDAAVTVAVARSRIEAELIAGLLRSYGLRAAVSADDGGGQEPVLQMVNGVRVQVARSEEASARQILAADHSICE